jgi:hypothetical protein
MKNTQEKKQYDMNYRLKNAERIKKYNQSAERKQKQAEYVKKSNLKPEIRKRRKEYYKKWRSSPSGKLYQRIKDLMKLHHLTYEEYMTMAENQNGCCKICGINQNNLLKALCVDHDHRTDKIRGLLCDKCNKALGLFDDDIINLINAVEYLKSFQYEIPK